MSSNIILDIKNISKTYKQKGVLVNALSNVSFALNHSQSLGIIGESGAGKSTIANLIQGLESPGSGSINFHKDTPKSKKSNKEILDISKISRLKRSKIVQTIFQDPHSALNPKFKIKDSINEILDLHKKSQKKLKNLLEEVHIEKHLLNRYPHELSGGQSQRIVIARALIPDPKIIIADEATASLDVSIKFKILNLLKQLVKKNQVSIIFISHDIKTISHFTDNILVLYKGKIVESNSATNIINNPQNSYTQKLINSIPDPNNKEKYLE